MNSLSDEKKPVVVVIVDSGIDTSISDLSKYTKKIIKYGTDKEGYIVELPDASAKTEHGTAIAMIIRHICKNVEFISINILNERLSTDGRILIYALEKTLEYSPDIIHLSLGTTRWRYSFALKSIARKALRQNTTIVCAADNNAVKSYPSCLRGVIGVKIGNAIDCFDLEYEDGFFVAPSGLAGVEGADKLFHKDMAGTSMAAGYVTGHMANLIYNNRNSECKKLKEVLKNKALKSY